MTQYQIKAYVNRVELWDMTTNTLVVTLRTVPQIENYMRDHGIKIKGIKVIYFDFRGQEIK